MAEAAVLLGTSKDAIRMRVRRGSLRSEKGEDGRVYVFVEPDRDRAADATTQAEDAGARSATGTVPRTRRLKPRTLVRGRQRP
jgi:hypothetical protein